MILFLLTYSFGVHMLRRKKFERKYCYLLGSAVVLRHLCQAFLKLIELLAGPYNILVSTFVQNPPILQEKNQCQLK